MINLLNRNLWVKLLAEYYEWIEGFQHTNANIWLHLGTFCKYYVTHMEKWAKAEKTAELLQETFCVSVMNDKKKWITFSPYMACWNILNADAIILQ